MMNALGSYDDIWKAIILPNKQEYNVYDLGPTDIIVQGNKIQRTDFRLANKRGYSIQCSYFQQVNMTTPIPCVVYLHANGCSRLEALQYMDAVLSNPVSYFCFDFSGCGKSDGKYTSVGWYEQDDLECVIQYLYNTGKVSKVAVWGRSMGAATALMYATKDPRISCLIFDSPFCTFKKLVKELVTNKAPIPEFLVTGALKIIRTTVQKKANFDIDALRPIDYVDQISMPALFGAGKDDSFVSCQHTQDLYKKYGGHKQLMLFDGDHNSLRPPAWTKLVKEFLRFHLLGEKCDSQIPKKSIKNLFSEKPPESSVTAFKFEQQQPQPAAVASPISAAITYQTNQPASQQASNMNFSWLTHNVSSPAPLSANHTPQNSGVPEKFTQKYGTDVKPENYHHHVSKPKPAEKKLHGLFNPQPPLGNIQHSKSVQGYLNVSSHANNIQSNQQSPRLLSKGYFGPTNSNQHDQSLNHSIHSNHTSKSISSEVQQKASIFGIKENRAKNTSTFDHSLNQFDNPKPSISLRDASNYHLNTTAQSHSQDQKPKRKIFGPDSHQSQSQSHHQARSPQSSTLPRAVAASISGHPGSETHPHRNYSPSPVITTDFSSQRRGDSQQRARKIFEKGGDSHSNSAHIIRPANTKSFTSVTDTSSQNLIKEALKETPAYSNLGKNPGLHVEVHSNVPYIPSVQAGVHAAVHGVSTSKYGSNDITSTSLAQLDARRISENYSYYPQYSHFETKDHNMVLRNNGY